jgi:hypothetical protein
MNQTISRRKWQWGGAGEERSLRKASGRIVGGGGHSGRRVVVLLGGWKGGGVGKDKFTRLYLSSILS